MKTALIVGASNLDIKGQSDSPLVAHTKNPGTVQATAGGVGRNIAENLARLGVATTLLSVLGDDVYARHVVEETAKSGVDVRYLRQVPDMPTGVFLAVLNSHGDLESAISDMGVLSRLGADYLREHEHLFAEAGVVVLDADIPEESLVYCAEQCERHGIPLAVEPISPARSRDIVQHLHRFSLITPNREEAEVLAGFPLRTAEDIERAGRELVQRGCRQVVITLGGEGVFAATAEQAAFLPSISTVVTDTVGAGDALMAGTVAALLEGVDLFDAVRQGIAAATVTLGSRLAVHPELSRERIQSFLARSEETAGAT